MNAYLGEIIALITAICWAITSLFFTVASEQVGSQIVNRIRLSLAALLLSATHLLWRGQVLPIHAEPFRWRWLGLSAIAGLVVGDGLLFHAFTLIGARLSMLLMTLVPVIGTLLAWVFLHETLSLMEISAVVVTVSSVAWVVLERGSTTPQAGDSRHYLVGVLCGMGGAVGQASGLILSKQGMSGDFSALSASLMRLLVASVVVWLGALLQGQVRPTIEGLRNERARRAILGGALAGPFIGMTLSLAAVQLTHVGIASTLMSLSPVILLPLVHWVFKEHISRRATLGTIMAMIGMTMIFLV